MRLADKKCNKSGLVGDFTEAPADVEIVGDNLGDSWQTSCTWEESEEAAMPII